MCFRLCFHCSHTLEAQKACGVKFHRTFISSISLFWSKLAQIWHRHYTTLPKLYDIGYICKICLQVKKMTALRIESFPCNHSINVVLTGFNSTKQRIQVKFKAKIVNLWHKSYLNAIKTIIDCFYKIINIINLCQICYGFMKATLFWTLHSSAFTKTTDTFNKNKRCHMALEWLISVCAKLEPVSSKNKEIVEINVLQKFTLHALSLNKDSLNPTNPWWFNPISTGRGVFSTPPPPMCFLPVTFLFLSQFLPNLVTFSN